MSECFWMFLDHHRRRSCHLLIENCLSGVIYHTCKPLHVLDVLEPHDKHLMQPFSLSISSAPITSIEVEEFHLKILQYVRGAGWRAQGCAPTAFLNVVDGSLAGLLPSTPPLETCFTKDACRIRAL